MGIKNKFKHKTKTSDSTFDLNLAPILDIIVSVVPMLLLSVAFVQVKMIDTPVPQVIDKKSSPDKADKVRVSLLVRENDFEFIVESKGKKQRSVASTMEQLKQKAEEIKNADNSVEDLELLPNSQVSLQHIVKVMDEVRKTKDGQSLFANVYFGERGAK